MFGKPSKTPDIHGYDFHVEVDPSGVLSLRTCEGEDTERDCLAGFLSLVESGIACTTFPVDSEVVFLALRIVTF